jgi:diaminopimelate epimerase
MRFTKMHGIGNDYVYVSLFEEQVKDPAALARGVSDRHFGIGSDGLILIGPSASADVRMRIFNADGSEAEMCGNGIRCVAKFAYERGLCRKTDMSVETGAGVKTVRLVVESGAVVKVRVDMGIPRLRRFEIPMAGPSDERCADAPLRVCDREVLCTCVNMGNPHCVIFVEDVKTVDLARMGPAIENHLVFPQRTNAHFAQALGRGEVRMITWERGSGVTLACGTGASAVCVAGAITGRTNRRVLVHLPGGDLELDYGRDEHVHMTGPATEVFTGEWPEA